MGGGCFVFKYISESDMSEHKTKQCVIFVNGEIPDPVTVHRLVEEGELLVAADGGARHALALDLLPHVVIGDLDSLDPDDEVQLRAANTHFLIHPVAKDGTDLELALTYAVEQDADPIVVVGALGGRLDQLLSNILLLTMPILEGRDVRLVHGLQTAFVIRDRAVLLGKPGDTVSLIPLGGPAHGVTTHGLVYPLTEGSLPFGLSLGVSNEMTGKRAEVSVRDGVLFCVHISLET
jgi:thiamine pyrophosphokinase